MLRNNNQKILNEVDDYEWHFLIYAMPGESRRAIQSEFIDKMAEPLAAWIADKKRRGKQVQIWWHHVEKAMRIQFM